MPPYEYEWRWNDSGIFTASSPGAFLGDSENIVIREVLNCPFFFLELTVTSNDGITEKYVRKITADLCDCCLTGGCFDQDQSQERYSSSNSHLYNLEAKVSFSPFDQQININIRPENTGQTVFLLYSATGQLVVSVNINSISNGSFHKLINTASLPSGIYFYTLFNGKDLHSDKILIR
ncbi:MAG: T9SS type A sorting domain-containing protein [Bacteroidota bacterium]